MVYVKPAPLAEEGHLAKWKSRLVAYLELCERRPVGKMEESPSGLWRRLGKAVYPHGYRGFKSHLFRSTRQLLPALLGFVQRARFSRWSKSWVQIPPLPQYKATAPRTSRIRPACPFLPLVEIVGSNPTSSAILVD